MERYGNAIGTLLDCIGNALGTLMERYWNTNGTLLERKWYVFGSMWNAFGRIWNAFPKIYTYSGTSEGPKSITLNVPSINVCIIKNFASKFTDRRSPKKSATSQDSILITLQREESLLYESFELNLKRQMFYNSRNIMWRLAHNRCNSYTSGTSARGAEVKISIRPETQNISQHDRYNVSPRPESYNCFTSGTGARVEAWEHVQTIKKHTTGIRIFWGFIEDCLNRQLQSR